jgi:hypothetical protein
LRDKLKYPLEETWQGLTLIATEAYLSLQSKDSTLEAMIRQGLPICLEGYLRRQGIPPSEIEAERLSEIPKFL